MRKIFFTIIVLLILIFATPYFMGYLAQNKIEQITNTVNSLAPVKIKIISYNRGWISSNAKAIVTLPQIQEPNSTVPSAITQSPELKQIIVTAKINHGPLAFNRQGKIKLVQALINANIELSDTQNAFVKYNYRDADLATIDLQISLSGCSTINIKGPSFIYKKDSTTLNWQGMEVEMYFSRTLDKLSYTCKFPGLDLTLPTFELHLAGFKSYFNGIKDPEEIWLGGHKVSIQAFSIKNAQQPRFALTNLQLDLNTSAEKNLVNLALNESTDSIEFDGTKYQNNKLAFNANSLNKKLLAKLCNQFKHNYFNWQQKMQLFNMLVELLNSGGTFNLRTLESSTPWGKIGLKLNLITILQNNENGFLALLANSNLAVEISAEQKLVVELLHRYFRSKSPAITNPQNVATTTLTAWINSGKIISKGSNLFINIEYKNNSLTFNGKSTTLGKQQ